MRELGTLGVVLALATTPRNLLLTETDSPYMAPEPHRGSRNDSGNLVYVAEKIAELKGITAKEVENATLANARKLFLT